MNSFVGVVLFTVGLGLFVFPVPIAAGISEWAPGLSDHTATVAVRAVGLGIVAVGTALIFL